MGDLIQEYVDEVAELLDELLTLAGVAPDTRVDAIQLFRVAIEDLIGGDDEEDDGEVLEAVAGLLDGLVVLEVLIPGIAGKVLEAYDGPAILQVLEWISDLFKVDPVKKAARQAARAERKADRKAEREAKKTARAVRKAIRKAA